MEYLKEFKQLLEELKVNSDLNPENFKNKKWLNIDLSPDKIRNNIEKLVKSSGLSRYNLDNKLKFLSGEIIIHNDVDNSKIINEKMSRILLLRYLLEIRYKFPKEASGYVIEDYLAGIIQGENVKENNQIVDIVKKTGISKGTYQIKFKKEKSHLMDLLSLMKYICGKNIENTFNPNVDYLLLAIKKLNSDDIEIINIDINKLRKNLNINKNIEDLINDIDNKNTSSLKKHIEENKDLKNFVKNIYNRNYVNLLKNYDFTKSYYISIDDLEKRTKEDLEEIYTELKNVYDSLGMLINDVNELVSGANFLKEKKRSYDDIAKSVNKNSYKFDKSFENLIKKIYK